MPGRHGLADFERLLIGQCQLPTGQDRACRRDAPVERSTPRSLVLRRAGADHAAAVRSLAPPSDLEHFHDLERTRQPKAADPLRRQPVDPLAAKPHFAARRLDEAGTAWKKVVFPAPLGLIKPTISPHSTSSETLSTALRPPNWTETSRAESMILAAVGVTRRSGDLGHDPTCPRDVLYRAHRPTWRHASPPWTHRPG